MSKSLIGRLMLDLEGMSLSKEENEILLNPHVGGVILFAKNIQLAASMDFIITSPDLKLFIIIRTSAT